jgi:fatty-acyl-CoA synthase
MPGAASVTQSIVRGAPLCEEAGLGTLTLPGFLREVTDRFTTREALVQTLPGGQTERWSYTDLWARAVEVSKALIANGLGKGERVGVLMTNRAEFLSAFFGTALAGGIAAPLSTFSTASELEHLVANSACSVLLLERHVHNKDFSDILRGLEPAIMSSSPGKLASTKFPFLRRLAVVDSAENEGALEAWPLFLRNGQDVDDALVEARMRGVTPADPGGLFFSSGSTSKPKGILSAQRGMAIQLWRMAAQQGLKDGVRSWTANGFFWSGNFAMIIGGTLAQGGSLVLQRIFQAEEALFLMQAERVDFLFAWPHQWAQLIASPDWSRADLSALHYVDADGPIARHPTVETNWIEPRHSYGNTETFTLSAAYPANTPREIAAGSHGLPLPGNTLKIVDPSTGIVVPIGARGEIAIKGPTLMLGYLGVPLTDTLDEEGFFRTGDGGFLDAQGRLFWEGRLNDIIKTGGANVSPVEIDDVIQACPGVKIAQTVGVPDELLGELVVTCVVPEPGALLSESLVRAFARQNLASFKVPRRVLFFDEGDLQLTGSAKVKTNALRELAAKRM